MPAAVGFGLLISHFYARERDQIQSDSLLTARALIHAVDRDLNNGIIVALALASSPSLDAGDLAGFRAQASGVLRSEFPGLNFVLSDRDANQLLNTLRPLGAPMPDPASAARIRKVFDLGEPIISDLFIGGALKRPLTAIHVPVIRNGKVIYCLSVGFPPERIGKVLAEQRLPASRFVAILDRSGTIVARTHEPERFVGKKASALLMAGLKRPVNEDAIETFTLEGVGVYSMYSRSVESGWTVVIGVPRSIVLSELLASLTWISWTVLALLLAGLGAAWYLGGKISASVRALATAAIGLGSGVRITPRSAAFREAQDAAVTLCQVDAELQKHRHHLDQLIAERTLQLEQLNEQLVLARNTAEAGNKAKSAFVANMSHELRTPMNAVLGMAHLLGNTALSAEQLRYLDMIQASSKSLLGILNDILDFSKIEAGKFDVSATRFDLDEVLHGVATIMSVNAGDKDLELAIGVEPNVPRALVGDALRLQQILVNLTGNAIKFTPQGEVALLVELLVDDNDAVVLCFTVRDTGIGISAEQQERLFTAFTQADSSTTRRFGGTGLGLTISKRLIELLGGNITVRSTPAKGSEFRFTMPLRRDREQAPAAPAPNALRLLLVDDNPTSRNYLGKTIQRWRWQVDSVGSGAEAVARVREAHAAGQAYDLMLIDWQMPDMDGHATRRAISAQLGEATPTIIMVNAYGRKQMLADLGGAADDMVLTKPVTASSLFDAVQQALALSRHALPAPLPQQRRRIDARLLLVEDNVMNQAVARGILEHAGAVVDVADNGAQAVELLRSRPGDYALILMDVQMPVMDGFTATRLIRGTLGLTLPILAMTAGVMESEREECVASGMNDFIGKPVDVEQMLDTIARHMPPDGGPGGVADQV
ncbi:response regulator [Oxalobacteraceae bacterium]|nr:response regulator [Oxalobacteraceae bacterium]